MAIFNKTTEQKKLSPYEERLRKQRLRSIDLTTLEGLSERARLVGLEKDVSKILGEEKKIGFLGRLAAGLGSLSPAEAILRARAKKYDNPLERIGLFGKEYGKTILSGLGTAITGKDIGRETQRRGFKEVFKDVGLRANTGKKVVDNILNFGIGFLGDVLLDPSTYFGGVIARGITKGVKVGAGVGLKGIGKVAPKTEAVVRLAGAEVREATGKAFKYGFKTTEGLPEKALEIQSRLAKVKEEIVLSNINRLGTGILSKSQSEELVQKLLAGKRGEFIAGRGTLTGKELAKKVAVSDDPIVKRVISEQIERSKKFAKTAGLKDPFEVYYPSLRNDNVSRFLEGTKQLKVGSQGYLKQFKNILTDEQLIKNPAEAFAKREFDIVKDRIIGDQLRVMVKDIGKPLNTFKNSDEALRNGYKLVKEKGLYGKELGYLKEVDKKFIDNLITPEFSTIDNIAKATGFDALTSLFKRSVTGLFAPFHIRNYVSGMIQNFETLGIKALNPKNISLGHKMAWIMARKGKIPQGTLNVAGKPTSIKKLFKAFEDRFGTSSSYITDIADATKGLGMPKGKLLGKESLKETAKTLGLGQQAIHFRVARGVGNFIETQQKATAYITALKEGKTIKEALKLAEMAGFDYRALTPFESKIMRRIIPFYSFTRKNIELQLKTLGENPQRINQVIKLIENIQTEKPTEEEWKYLPDYIKDSFGIRIGETPEGLKTYIASFGTPIEAFAELFNRNPVLKGISMANPILKVPLEIGIGKDSFRQRDLKDVYSAKEVRILPKLLKNALDVKEVEKPVYERDRFGRLKKTGTKKVYVADPVKLLIFRSLFTARGFSYLDQMFGGDLEGMVKAMKLTTGLKPYGIDIESQKFFREREAKRKIEDLLLKTGELKRFERLYEPKK
jgi:hypothetical protein